MADFLTAIKSVRKQTDSKGEESLLTKVKTSDPALNKSTIDEPQQLSGRLAPNQTARDAHSPATSPTEALHVLRSQPDQSQLLALLRQLEHEAFADEPFSLHCSGPLQAQIINALLVDVVPNFWAILTRSEQTALVACLQNVAGLNAVVARIGLTVASHQQCKQAQSTQLIADLIQVAQHLLTGDHVLSVVWRGLSTHVDNKAKREMIWKESTALLSSGRIVSVLAQAEDVLQSKSQCWLANGNEYAAWLGRNVATLARMTLHAGSSAAAALSLDKAMTLGYPNMLLTGLFGSLLNDGSGARAAPKVLEALLLGLPAHVKRMATEYSLRWLSTLGMDAGDHQEDSKTVAAMAAFLSMWIQDDSNKQHVTSFLANAALLSSVSMLVRRASITALAAVGHTDEIYRLLEKLMSTFSDRLFIAHAPNTQQENLVQTLLFLSGSLHREKPVAFLVLARSSYALQGVSNRLDSSKPRARWLGMVVGTAISRLVDKEGSRMNFGTEEMENHDAVWFLGLTGIHDRISTLQEFAALLNISKRRAKLKRSPKPVLREEAMPEVDGKPVFGPLRPPAQTEVIGERVTELLDDDADEDDDDGDLKPYAKPDSDPEDSDEDATLVNRHKIRPPVYIRDLMSMLRDDQNHDRFQQAIKHATSLIRRKAGFGAEVKDHAEELAAILCNLRDPFETEAFDELKLQALIAVLLADVKVLAPWLSKQAFSGDYSIAQRCIILSALGLGGREFAGFANQDELNPKPANTSFPSKQLPPHLHSIYVSATPAAKHLEAASADMERILIQPIALQAADKSTAHLNAVKVRTFSSRMDVERTKRKPAPNQLAKIFGKAFFFPLTNRYQQEIAAYGSASVFASTPFVLVTFLKTIALLLHAAGPATANLPQICAEFWDLLLSLRVSALANITVLQALLFSLLTLLEVNFDKRQIVESFPKQLMETQQWVDLVFERTGGGNLVSENQNDDEAKIRTLAAGVLVKSKEIIDAYQKQLVDH